MTVKPRADPVTFWSYGDQFQNPYLLKAGVASLLVFAFFYLTVPDVGRAGFALVVASGLVLLYRLRWSGFASGAFFLLGFAIVVQVLSWYFSPDTYPEFLESYPKLDRMGRWFAFIFIALWLCGSSRNIYVFWSCCLAGFLLAPWITGEGWSEWSEAFSGRRVDFGMRNAQHTALMFGAGLIGLIIFYSRIVSHREHAGIRFVIWAVPFLMCLAGIIVTQTRGVWLAFLAGMLVISILAFGIRSSISSHFRTKRIIALFLVFLALVSVLAFILFSDHVTQRIEKERETITNVLEGGLDGLPVNSIGIRIHSWAVAIDWIAERPWLGWGKRGSAMLLKHSDGLPPGVREFGHLHNSYLDVLVQYGIFGLAVMLSLFGWLVYITIITWRAKQMSNDMFLFCCGFMAYWLVANMFESFMFYSTGRYLLNILAAGMLAEYTMRTLRFRKVD